MNKELVNAIKNVLKVRIDRGNYGMLSNAKNNLRDVQLLDRNNIDIYYDRSFNGKSNVIVQDEKIIGIIHRKYSSKKVNGMYKELQPKIELI